MVREGTEKEIILWMRGYAFARGLAYCDAAADLIERQRDELLMLRSAVEEKERELEAARREMARLRKLAAPEQEREEA